MVIYVNYFTKELHIHEELIKLSKPKIVILGAGYGGMITSRNLSKLMKNGEADVTLVNKHDYHYITTQLHKTGAGTAPDGKIALPIRELIDHEKIHFRKDTVTAIDFDGQKVSLQSGDVLDYDFLVVCLGFQIETFGIPGVREHGFALRSFRSSKKAFHHIEKQFILYKEDQDPARLTFTVAGAGFTGIEMVGELFVKLPKLAKKYDIPYEKVRIINVEASNDLLPGFDRPAIEYTTELLDRMGVEIMTGHMIKECREDVVITNKTEIPTRTLIWSCGVRGHKLFEEAGLETVKGKLPVDQYLRAKEYDNVFCIGDNALFMQDEKTALPPTAQVALQQAPVCAKNILATIRNEQLKPFVYHHKGCVASISDYYAVGVVGGIVLKGKIAAFMKQVIEYRYLFYLGGPKLMWKQFRGKYSEPATVTVKQQV